MGHTHNSIWWKETSSTSSIQIRYGALQAIIRYLETGQPELRRLATRRVDEGRLRLHVGLLSRLRGQCRSQTFPRISTSSETLPARQLKTRSVELLTLPFCSIRQRGRMTRRITTSPSVMAKAAMMGQDPAAAEARLLHVTARRHTPQR